MWLSLLVDYHKCGNITNFYKKKPLSCCSVIGGHSKKDLALIGDNYPKYRFFNASIYISIFFFQLFQKWAQKKSKKHNFFVKFSLF
jgi:hypothetical protein